MFVGSRTQEFQQALSGVGPVFLSFLAIHVPASLVAVVSGASAATARKGKGRHTRSGTIYFWAIATVFASATGMAAMRLSQDYYLIVLGALAFSLAAAGRDVRHHPLANRWCGWHGHAPHIVAMGGSYTILFIAFLIDNGKKLPLWDQLPTAAYWSIPTIVASPLILRALVHHRRPRTVPVTPQSRSS